MYQITSLIGKYLFRFAVRFFLMCFAFSFMATEGILPGLIIVLVMLLFEWILVRRDKQLSQDWVPNVYGENAYAILGVQQNASYSVIEAAFQRLAARFQSGTDSENDQEDAGFVISRLLQAFDLLSNKTKRFQYDAWIESLDGRAPPLDEAYARLKSEPQHPLYAGPDVIDEGESCETRIREA